MTTEKGTEFWQLQEAQRAINNILRELHTQRHGMSLAMGKPLESLFRKYQDRIKREI